MIVVVSYDPIRATPTNHMTKLVKHVKIRHKSHVREGGKEVRPLNPRSCCRSPRWNHVVSGTHGAQSSNANSGGGQAHVKLLVSARYSPSSSPRPALLAGDGGEGGQDGRFSSLCLAPSLAFAVAVRLCVKVRKSCVVVQCERGLVICMLLDLSQKWAKIPIYCVHFLMLT